MKQRVPAEDAPHARMRTIGWSLGSACPYRCTHCYSRAMRVPSEGLTRVLIDRVAHQCAAIGVHTVVLGGNEPIYTHGLRLADSALPYIIDTLADIGIRVALVTSGPSAVMLNRIAPDTFASLEMVFASFDAPDARRHDANRGAALFKQATASIALAQAHSVDSSMLYCATSENFSRRDIQALTDLARKLQTRLRINTLKPSNPGLLPRVLSPEAFLAGFQQLTESCHTDLVDDPSLRHLLGLPSMGSCPCGTTTFRISHMREDGSLPVTPCIYVEAARSGDLRRQTLSDIVEAEAFRSFADPVERGFKERPHEGYGCRAQGILQCTPTGADPIARSTSDQPHGFLAAAKNVVEDDQLRSVFGGYLCTWMGRPK